MKKIFTLGLDRRDEEDFIEILFAYDIKAAIDVKTPIRSSKMPAFTGKNLKELLEREGLEYHFLGDDLGGLRKGGYKAYVLTDDFRQGIERLEVIAYNKLSVVVCTEKLPWKCHRKWISRALQKNGWHIEHIIDKGKIWTPTQR